MTIDSCAVLFGNTAIINSVYSSISLM